MNQQTLDHDSTRQFVRERYGKIAEEGQAGCGCGPACCRPASDAAATGSDPNGMAHRVGYAESETEAVPAGANLGLGCGNPLAIASLQPGQTVLDLGCGAGFDALLAARQVGRQGRVIGVDMTPQMISRARANAARGEYEQVDFRLGEIEHLPVADASVDVIISNCVINLSPDKEQVFAEAFRALRPGGRLAISDIVALAPVPQAMRRDVALYTACAAGAAEVSDLVRMLQAAGFVQIQVNPRLESRDVIAEWFPGRNLEDYFASATIEAIKPATFTAGR